jgi:hypothetical protein
MFLSIVVWGTHFRFHQAKVYWQTPECLHVVILCSMNQTTSHSDIKDNDHSSIALWVAEK